MNSSTPLSGWLHKLSTAKTFGVSRWQSRYFVLLDSEMRYYKNEHSDTASRTVNLGDIAKVINTSTPNQPYSFRLEPTLYGRKNQCTKHQQKIWTMACESEYEFQSWVSAIDHRLQRRRSSLLESHNNSEESGIVSPTLEPFSTPEQMRSQPLMSISQALATYPHQETISRTKGDLLSVLDVQAIPALDTDMLSSTTCSSRDSSLFSPKIKDCHKGVDAYPVDTFCALTYPGMSS